MVARFKPKKTYTIIDAIDDPDVFQPWFGERSWQGWRAILKAAFALPMDDSERAFLREVAERDPPTKPVKELWIVAGRRAGKDSIASLIAAHVGSMFGYGGQNILRPGENAHVLCLALDRDQASIVLNYTRAYFDLEDKGIPRLAGMVIGEKKDGLILKNKVEITVATNSFRSIRGRTVL
jgi:hypothetical protein